jgi:hypothetical protein
MVPLSRRLAAAAAGGVFVNFTKKALRAILGDRAQTSEGIGKAAPELGLSEKGIGSEKKQRSRQSDKRELSHIGSKSKIIFGVGARKSDNRAVLR